MDAWGSGLDHLPWPRMRARAQDVLRSLLSSAGGAIYRPVVVPGKSVHTERRPSQSRATSATCVRVRASFRLEQRACASAGDSGRRWAARCAQQPQYCACCAGLRPHAHTRLGLVIDLRVSSFPCAGRGCSRQRAKILLRVSLFSLSISSPAAPCYC